MSNIASMMAGDEDGLEGAHHELRKDCNPHASTFAGREGELAKLVEMLQKSSFVAITGEPGVGKSTLALVGATTVQANMGSGAFYADLGGRIKPGAIFASNTSSLKVTPMAVASGRPDRMDI